MNEKELRTKSENYAKKAGFKLNSDKKVMGFVIKGLLKNKGKYGKIYCPCRVVTGDKEKDKDIICPCIFHKQEIKERGHCKCNLFVNGKKSKTNNKEI